MFALLPRQRRCCIDQNTEDDRAIIIDQIDEPSFGDKPAELDQLPRSLAPLHYPRPCIVTRDPGLMPMSCRSYAATIHKAQGMTVDRVHVLATPGLDRHAAYVALSRHRDSVLLHYGQDDFADPGRLTSTLSRERAKDMAQDHLRSQAPVPAVPVPARTALRDPLPGAVVRHAYIVREMRASYDWGDAYTPAQRHELIESRSALDRIHPNAARDLESALAVNMRLIGEAADGRPANAVRAMAFEARLRVDPQLRADTFVQRWQALDRQRRLLLRDHETSRADKLAGRMMGMAKSLERDPQVESILRSRRADLGLPKTAITGVGQSLSDVISVTRTRGLGLGV